MVEEYGGKGAPDTGDSRSFSIWLKVMAEYAGVTEPAQLQAFLLDHGCQCTRDAAAEWLSGRDPSYEKSRDIIKAFHDAFPELEVWDEYKRFVRGEPFMKSKPAASPHAAQTLQQILKKTGLPPGLSD